MKDLKWIIRNYPHCLQNSRTLFGVLKDCGWDDRMAHILIRLFDDGIIDKIRQNGNVLPQTEVYHLVSRQEVRYGTAQQFVKEGIQLWADALGAEVELPHLQEKKQDSAVQKKTESATVKRQRSRFEKVVLAIGYVAMVLPFGVFAICASHFDVVIEELKRFELDGVNMGWMAVAPLLLIMLTFLMQIRLQRKGFAPFGNGNKMDTSPCAVIFMLFLFSVIALGTILSFANQSTLRFCIFAFALCAVYQMLWLKGQAISDQQDKESSGGVLFWAPLFLVLFFTFGDLLF